MGVFRVVALVVVMAVYTFVLMPVQSLAIRRKWPIAAKLPWYWQRIACAIVGIRVRVDGAPATTPLLIAANHISWLDISVLGSVLPVSFVAKAEVAGWPVIGTLARPQRTVFIDRTRRSQTASATEAIAERVGRGDVIVLFAEGTTGDGNRVLPFRSALLGAARAASGSGLITVQPVAITYTAIHGVPIGRVDRPMIAWYGDMELPGHFLKLVTTGGLDAVVSFGEPIAFGPGEDRKQVADRCFVAVCAMVDEIRRHWPVSPDRHRGPVFSPSAKGAKASPEATPADEAGETVRLS
jgi:1-acyl-sn-glycerol-3-phosphate acyltransferase